METSEIGPYQLGIWVPEPNTRTSIAPGSGIVGLPQEGRIRIDYEGALLGPSNIQSYGDKLWHAAGRMLANYPTIARASLAPEQLVLVGRMEAQSILIVEEEQLLHWLGTPLSSDQLQFSDGSAERSWTWWHEQPFWTNGKWPAGPTPGGAR